MPLFSNAGQEIIVKKEKPSLQQGKIISGWKHIVTQLQQLGKAKAKVVLRVLISYGYICDY